MIGFSFFFSKNKKKRERGKPSKKETLVREEDSKDSINIIRAVI